MTANDLRWFFERVLDIAFSSFRSWDSFAAAVGSVPTVFTNFADQLAWPYLLSSLALAWGVYARAGRTGSAAHGSFLEFVFPVRIYRHPSARLDLRYMAVDILMAFLWYVPIYTGFALLGAKAASAVIVRGMGWEPPAALSPWEIVVATAAFLMLSDFIGYWAHVWFHSNRVLWSFHQVHHSAEVLTPATGNRVHPVENIIIAGLKAPAAGLAAMYFQNVLGSDREFVMIGGVSVMGFLFGLLGTHLRHSHIWLSFGPWLSPILISPAHHQLHHSVETRHWNKNFGAKLAIWDALFGTLYQPRKPEVFRIGLAELGSMNFGTVRQLYGLPFCRVWRLRVAANGRSAE